MKQTKRKTIIISSYDEAQNPVYAGGGAVSVRELSARLAKKYKVIVLYGKYKHAKKKKVGSVTYIPVGTSFFGPKIGQVIFPISLLWFARNLNYDFWIESSQPPFTFSVLPLFIKKPLIAWVHMICSYEMKRKYFFNFRIGEALLCKNYSHIVVPTKWVKKEVLAMNNKAKIYEVAYGYEQCTKLKKSEVSEFKQNFFLYLGRIEVKQKGLDLLLQSIATSNSKPTLVIAGSGQANEMKSVRKYVKEYNLENNVKFVGRVNDHEKSKLIKKCAAVVLPSRFETFGITLLEALSYQKPVICFDILQLKWIPQKFALKVRPYDTLNFSKTLDRVIDKKYPESNTRDLKKFLKSFSWKSVSLQFDQCLENIAL